MPACPGTPAEGPRSGWRDIAAGTDGGDRREPGKVEVVNGGHGWNLVPGGASPASVTLLTELRQQLELLLRHEGFDLVASSPSRLAAAGRTASTRTAARRLSQRSRYGRKPRQPGPGCCSSAA